MWVFIFTWTMVMCKDIGPDLDGVFKQVFLQEIFFDYLGTFFNISLDEGVIDLLDYWLDFISVYILPNQNVISPEKRFDILLKRARTDGR